MSGLARMAWALVFPAMPSHALDVRLQPVAEGVYAHIGDKGSRGVANEGLNANIGLVVTPDGAVLIDSGATWSSAGQIDRTIKRVTAQPVRWVISTGGQDHRWFGNGYFKAQGAELIAHVAARADMRSRGGDQLAALQVLPGDKAVGMVPTLPTRWIVQSDARLDLGGLVFEPRHHGGGHTPGELTDLDTARAQTRDYLMALRAHMRKAVDDGTDLSAAVRAFDAKPFMHLLNAAGPMPGNGSRTYLEIEHE